MELEIQIVRDPCQDLAKQRLRVFGPSGGNIGRAPDNYWALPDPKCYVSGQHCEIEFRDGELLAAGHEPQRRIRQRCDGTGRLRPQGAAGRRRPPAPRAVRTGRQAARSRTADSTRRRSMAAGCGSRPARRAGAAHATVRPSPRRSCRRSRGVAATCRSAAGRGRRLSVRRDDDVAVRASCRRAALDTGPTASSGSTGRSCSRSGCCLRKPRNGSSRTSFARSSERCSPTRSARGSRRWRTAGFS